MTLPRGARRPRAVAAKASRAVNAANRKGMGTLASRRVQARTLTRYNAALNHFFEWMSEEGEQLPGRTEDLDVLTCRWVEYCWQDGHGQGRAADVVCSLCLRSPSLRGHFNGSWALLKAWKRTELPTRAPPLPAAAVFAIAEWCLRQGHHGMALGMIVAAHCLLRTGEMLKLTFGQITWAEDYSSVVISLGTTKSGARRGAAESCQVELPWLAAAMKAMQLRREASDTLVGMAEPLFRRLFGEALRELGFAEWGFQPYSLRRGGATELWRSCGILSKVTLRGRWGHATTTRIYVNDGLAVLAEMKLPPQPQQALRDAFVARFRCSGKLF